MLPIGTSATCQPCSRPLYTWEIEEAHHVFGEEIKYDHVRVHECAIWTDVLDQLGRRLKRMPARAAGEHNAITLGHNCFFPVHLPESPTLANEATVNMIGWLMHELTHVWQFERMGWRYLWRSLLVQFREGANAYNFGGLQGLIERRKEGWTLTQFNLEQQGEIVRTYYCYLKTGKDLTPLLPYIQDKEVAT